MISAKKPSPHTDGRAPMTAIDCSACIGGEPELHAVLDRHQDVRLLVAVGLRDELGGGQEAGEPPRFLDRLRRDAHQHRHFRGALGDRRLGGLLVGLSRHGSRPPEAHKNGLRGLGDVLGGRDVIGDRKHLVDRKARRERSAHADDEGIADIADVALARFDQRNGRIVYANQIGELFLGQLRNGSQDFQFHSETNGAAGGCVPRGTSSPVSDVIPNRVR